MDYSTVGYVKLIVACALIAYLLFAARRASRGASASRAELAGLGLLAAVAVGSYYNFGWFHTRIVNSGWLSGMNHMHHWGLFHHYMGSKYFKELGHFELYNAAVVADAEGANLHKGARHLRNLRDYGVTFRSAVLARAPQIRGWFSAERWEQFKHDLTYFQNTRPPELRARLFVRLMLDHGYNATPVWNTTGAVLSHLIPVSGLIFISLLDQLLLLGLFVVIQRVFGTRKMLVVLTFFCTEFVASTYLWSGGSFLRLDWLVCLVLAYCALHQGRHATAGGLMAYATHARVFPLVFLFGPAIRALRHARRHRVIDAPGRRFFGAFVIAAVVLLGYGALAGRGIHNWPEHLKNLQIHSELSSDNHVGLARLVRPERISSGKGLAGWMQEHGRPFGFCVAFLALLASLFVVRTMNQAQAFSWGGVLVFFTLNPSCYYYAFLSVLVLHWVAEDRDGLASLRAPGLVAVQALGYLLLPRFYEADRFHEYLVVSIMLAVFLALVTAVEIHGARRARGGPVPG